MHTLVPPANGLKSALEKLGATGPIKVMLTTEDGAALEQAIGKQLPANHPKGTATIAGLVFVWPVAKLPSMDFEQKGNTTEHVIETRKQAAAPHQNRSGKTEPPAQ